jgi:hypothetical protein
METWPAETPLELYCRQDVGHESWAESQFVLTYYYVWSDWVCGCGESKECWMLSEWRYCKYLRYILLPPYLSGALPAHRTFQLVLKCPPVRPTSESELRGVSLVVSKAAVSMNSIRSPEEFGKNVSLLTLTPWDNGLPLGTFKYSMKFSFLAWL